jgi:hypothetical protein
MQTESSVKQTKKFPLLVPIVVLAFLVAIAALIIGTQVFAPKFENVLVSIEQNANNIGGASKTNYSPVLDSDIAWDSLSDSERATVARLAVGQTLEKANSDQASQFTITGVSEYTGSRQAVFFYSGGDSVSLFVNDQTSTIDLEE